MRHINDNNIEVVKNINSAIDHNNLFTFDRIDKKLIR